MESSVTQITGFFIQGLAVVGGVLVLLILFAIGSSQAVSAKTATKSSANVAFNRQALIFTLLIGVGVGLTLLKVPILLALAVDLGIMLIFYAWLRWLLLFASVTGLILYLAPVAWQVTNTLLSSQGG